MGLKKGQIWKKLGWMGGSTTSRYRGSREDGDDGGRQQKSRSQMISQNVARKYLFILGRIYKTCSKGRFGRNSRRMERERVERI